MTEPSTPEARAIDHLAAAVRDVVAALGPRPGPCPSEHIAPWLEGALLPPLRCQLRAGHAGDHEWQDPNGNGYTRWTDAGATSRDVAPS